MMDVRIFKGFLKAIGFTLFGWVIVAATVACLASGEGYHISFSAIGLGAALI